MNYLRSCNNKIIILYNMPTKHIKRIIFDTMSLLYCISIQLIFCVYPIMCIK